MDSSEFKRQYNQLNPEQKSAVDTIEGPVMVIAGPGTGKTQILTLRIANILRKTDTEPGSILSLTFTESAAYSMRQRLHKIIGSQSYRVQIFTFHGFCNEIIRNFPDYFPRIIGSTTASDVERIKIIEDIINRTKLSHLKPFGAPDYYVRPTLSSIQHLKRENISPTEFKKFINKEEKEFKRLISGDEKLSKIDRLRMEKRLEKNKELLAIFEQYEKTLAARLVYDYEDMILEVIRALENSEELLLSLQEEYQYILADEHQDANNSQNRILELISGFHKNPNLFIVGDEKQAIFRFQGASLQNFLHFKKLYPDALVLSLKTNYRSTQTILDASHSLIEKNQVEDPKLRQRLESKTKRPLSQEIKISFYEFNKPVFEESFIAFDIKRRIKAGAEPHTIAVFYRNNSDALPIVKALEQSGVPFEVYSDQSLFLQENIRKLSVFLRAVNSFGDESFLSELLFIDFFDFDNLDIYKLLNFGRRQKINLFDILSSEYLLKQTKVKNPAILSDFYKNMSRWGALARNKSLVDFLEIVVRESGYLKFLLSHVGVWDELNKLESFFDQAKTLSESHKEARLKDFINYLDILKQHNILVKTTSDYGPKKDAVKLMTAHKAKGLEFDYVYITGLYDGHWGNTRNHKHFHLPGNSFDPDLEDERRLFYVALTRAKCEVSLSFARANDRQKLRLPSQFVSEIDEKFIFKNDTFLLEQKFDKSVLKKDTVTPHKLEEKNYLRELFFDRGFSVTALNNYLECPWKYFFENLLRIPKAPGKSQMYGIAVHKALEDFFTIYKKGEDPGPQKLFHFFERSIKKQPLEKNDFEDSLRKGEKSLEGYYSFYKNTWTKNVIVELKIGGVVLDTLTIKKKKYPLILTGKLDKVEFTPDNKVNVVDYKTSQPKTRNQILGKTKSSRGEIYRQLLFYKILLDRFDSGKFKMISGEIDFTEKSKTGDFKKEKFIISGEETVDLIELIKKTAKEIASFSFWNKTCGVSDCRYCTLRKGMK
ncbi:MAG: ATP-dependent DNA helicase [Patescibacteria group bacterium]